MIALVLATAAISIWATWMLVSQRIDRLADAVVAPLPDIDTRAEAQRKELAAHEARIAGLERKRQPPLWWCLFSLGKEKECEPVAARCQIGANITADGRCIAFENPWCYDIVYRGTRVPKCYRFRNACDAARESQQHTDQTLIDQARCVEANEDAGAVSWGEGERKQFLE